MTPAGIDTDEALDLYRVMVTIRTFETTAGKLFAAGELPGFIHLSIGQEAVAAGVCAVLERTDEITTTHRGHGHCIAKGGKVFGMLAELYGSADGYGRGRSGSMHIADNTVGILGANAIVAAGLPMALGAAYSSQTRGDGRVAVAFFGDGAVAEGVFHETLNLAAIWQLPLVLVCENNRFAEMTPVSVHLANDRVADFAAPYGIPGVTVDGNDVLAVRAAAATAVARARAGEGPTLLEAHTHRVRGHFEGDPQRYRSAEDMAAGAARDPIAAFAQVLRDELGVDEATLAALESDVAAEVAAAAEAAAAAPPAPPDSLLDDVYPAGR